MVEAYFHTQKCCLFVPCLSILYSLTEAQTFPLDRVISSKNKERSIFHKAEKNGLCSGQEK